MMCRPRDNCFGGPGSMTPLDWLLLAFCVAATSLHVGTTALAMYRCRRPRQPLPAPEGAPAVSILRPVCGLDAHDELTLSSGFALDYPDFELIFCAARRAILRWRWYAG